MIIRANRISSLLPRYTRVGVTRNTIHHGSRTAILSATYGSDFSNCSASFSSVAPQQLQIPSHQQISPRVSLPPLTRSQKTFKNAPRIIRNIQDLVDRIPAAVHLRKTENIEPGALDDPVTGLLRRTNLPPHVWKKYSLFDSNKPYTRNLISTDHKTYTLLLLCWNPEQESPIHDHPCDGCWLQVLQGGIREVRYGRQLNQVSKMDYHEGQLSYITDNIGYHKVGNPTQKPAVSLHLYAPPFETCKCWHSDNADPSEPSEGKNVNHSEYGILRAA